MSRTLKLGGDAEMILVSAVPLVPILAFFLFDYHSPNALSVLAFCGLASVVYCFYRCWLQLGSRSELGQLAMHMAFAFWFFIPGFMRAIFSKTWTARGVKVFSGNEQFLNAFLAVGLCYFLFNMFYQIKPPKNFVVLGKMLTCKGAFISRKDVLKITYLGFCVGLVFYTTLSGGVQNAFHLFLSSRTEVKPWSPQGNFGTFISSFHILVGSGLIVASLFATRFILLERGMRSQKGFLILLSCLIAIGLILQSGTRSLLILMFFPPILLYIRKCRSNRRRKFSKYTVLLILALLALVASHLLREYRYSGSLKSIPNENFNKKLEEVDNDYLSAAALSFSVHDLYGKFLFQSTALTLIAAPIPRFLWPGKPEIEAMSLYSWYVWGFDIRKYGGNTLPSNVGQFYLNWGWVGVLELGVFLGMFVRILDVIIRDDFRSYSALLCSAIIGYIFLSFRIMSYSFMSPILLLAFFLFFFRALYSNHVKKNVPSTYMV